MNSAPDSRKPVRVRFGAPHLERVTYIIVDAIAVYVVINGVARRHWSPFWLLLAIPFALLGLGLLAGFALVWRLPALTLTGQGITIDADGKQWHCSWSDVLWLGLTPPDRKPQLLLAGLGPDAPQVGDPGSPPPALLADRSGALLFDFSEITGNRRKTIAAMREIAADKWRDRV